MADFGKELEIKVTADTSKADSAIKKFSEKVGGLSSDLDKLDYKKVDETAQSIIRLGKSSKNTEALQDSLGKISVGIKNLVNNLSGIDTTNLDKVVGLVENVSKISNKQLESAAKSAKKLNDNLKTDASSGIKKSYKTVEEFQDSIKDLGKDWQYVGTSSGIEKEILKTRKAIEDAKRKLREYNDAGKGIGDTQWEKSNRKLRENSNYLDTLIKKQQEYLSGTVSAGAMFDASQIDEAKKRLDEAYESLREYSDALDKGGHMKYENGEKWFYDPTSNIERSIESIKSLIPEVGEWKEQYEELLNSLEAELERSKEMFKDGIIPEDIDVAGIDTPVKSIEEKLQELYNRLDGISDGIKKKIETAINPKDLGAGQSYTKEYIDLQNQIEKTGKKLEDYYKKQEIAESKGNVNKTTETYIKLQTNIRNTEKELEKLTNDMQQLQADGKDVQSVSAFEKVGNVSNKAAGSMKVLSQGLRAIGLGSFATKVQQASANLNNLSSGLKGVGSSAENTKNKFNKWKIIIPIIAGVTATAAILIKVMKKVGSAITKAFSGLGKILKGVLTSIKGVALGILTIGSSSSRAQTAVGKLLNKIIQTFKSRILRQGITKALEYAKDGIDNLAVYSNNMGTSFNKNVSMIVSDMKYLGRVIATAFEPIVNVAAPMLDFLIQKLVSVINAINQFFNALTGSSTWTKATYNAENYASSVDSASSSAKELNKQIREWDKLNVITTPNSSNSGSGSGSGTSGNGFTTEEVSQNVQSFADKIKEAWDKASFTDIGRDLAKKLSDALNDIPWEDIQKNAEKVGKSLATLINGFISFPNLAETIGNAIAQACNTFIYGIDTFVDKLAWSKVGTFIGETIKSALDKTDFATLIELSGNLGKGIADAANALMNTDVLASVSKAIADLIKAGVSGWYNFVTEFNFPNLGKKIGNSINTFFEEMKTVSSDSGLTGWQELGQSISKSITGIEDSLITALDTVNWEGVGQSIVEFIQSIKWGDIFSKAKELLTKIANAIGDVFKQISETEEFKKAATTAAELIVGIIAAKLIIKGAASAFKSAADKIAGNIGTAIAESEAMQAMGETISGALGTIGTVAAEIGLAVTVAIASYKIGNWLYNNCSTIQKFSDGISAWVFKDGDSIAIARTISVTLTGLAISLAATSIISSIASGIALAVAGGISMTGVQLTLTNVALTIMDGAGVVWSGLETVATSLWTALGTAVSTCGTALSTIGTAITSVISGIGTFLGTSVTAAFTGGAASIAASLFACIGTAIVGWKIGNLIYEKFEDEIDNIVEKVGDFFTKTIPQALSDAGKAIVDFAVNVKGSIDEKAQQVKDWFADKSQQVKEFLSNAKGAIDEKAQQVKDWFADKTKQVKEFLSNAKGAIDEKAQQVKDWFADKTKQVKEFLAKGTASGKEAIEKIGNVWGGIVGGTKKLLAKGTASGKEAIEKLKKSWDKIKDKTKELAITFKDNFTAKLKQAWNKIANGINKGIDTINKIPGVSISKVPVLQYATGGFPEDGWFRANQGEIMGKFDNGKSVVANNQQITEGIASAVYKGNQEEIAVLRQQNALLSQIITEIVNKDTTISSSDIFNSVRKSNSNYKIINGQSAFV